MMFVKIQVGSGSVVHWPSKTNLSTKVKENFFQFLLATLFFSIKVHPESSHTKMPPSNFNFISLDFLMISSEGSTSKLKQPRGEEPLNQME